MEMRHNPKPSNELAFKERSYELQFRTEIHEPTRKSEDEGSVEKVGRPTKNNDLHRDAERVERRYITTSLDTTTLVIEFCTTGSGT